jgi:hypothetical protein
MDRAENGWGDGPESTFSVTNGLTGGIQKG